MPRCSEPAAGRHGPAGFDEPLWDSYAPFFDAEEGRVFPADLREMEFYRLLRSRFGTGRCMELGAGTGRLAAPLSSGSLTVFIEPSRGMLGLWRSSPGRTDVLVRALGQAVPLADGSIDLVVFACNGLHCILERSARISVLSEAGRVMTPGGWLLLETSPAFLRRPREDRAERYDYLDGGIRLRLVESVRRIDDRGSLLFDMAYTHGRGLETRIPLELALIDRDELLCEIEEAGLEVLHTWGDYDFSGLEDSSPRMLTAAARKGDR